MTWTERVSNEKILKEMVTKGHYTQNKKQAAEIYWKYKGRGLGEFFTQRAYRGQWKEAGHLPEKLI